MHIYSTVLSITLQFMCQLVAEQEIVSDKDDTELAEGDGLMTQVRGCSSLQEYYYSLRRQNLLATGCCSLYIVST